MAAVALRPGLQYSKGEKTAQEVPRMPGCLLQTPLGPLLAREEEGLLCGLAFAQPGDTAIPSEDTPLLREARRQLAAYFEGRLRVFDLPLRLEGTAFQRAVWARLTAIPYGQLSTYGRIAREIGRPGAARAVGRAIHLNPVTIVVPCHRVVGARGRLTGYAGGLARKQALLRLEQTP
jgi:methylated-DNA-[protein]-cysteine S-methyltransferase